MVKAKVSENMKRLFEYSGVSNKSREYKFYNFEGKLITETLRNSNRLHLTARCPRDNVRLVIYSGDPHNVIECPNCQYTPLTFGKYSKEKDIKKLDEQIKNNEQALELLKATRRVIANPEHPIVLANLEDKAMNLE